jgi:DNA-binding beta-propeller fold protein YncE
MICFWKFIKFLFNLGYSIVARIVIIGLLFSSGMLSQIVLAQDNGLNLIDSKIDDTSGVDGLSGTTSLDVSPDGLHLYATGFADNALAVFRRNIGTGQLTFVQTIKNSDIGNLGLKGANAILVSPDNKHVYVASTLDNAIVVFTRDTTTGQLTLVEIQQDSLNGGDGLGGQVV